MRGMLLAPLFLALLATAASSHPLFSSSPSSSPPAPPLLPAESDIRDIAITRNGSSLFLGSTQWHAVGPNIYWLGLDENVVPPPDSSTPFYAPLEASYPTKGRITEIMATVKALGGTMVRAHTLGVSTGNPLSIWPVRGEVNEEAFESVDWAVAQARAYGIRLLVPLTDNYDYYHGGKYNFLRWAGFNLTQTANSTSPVIQQFYTNETIISSFKSYIHTLVTHVNRYTNLTYAQDPTIFAYESGNELAGPVWGDMDVPVDWVREIGSYVKQLAPDKLFVDGTYGVNSSHFAVEEVDLFSDHFYPINITKLEDDLELVASADKAYFAGEFDWVGSTDGGATPDGDSLAEWFSIIRRSPVAAGDAFWSIFGHDVPNCHVFVNHSDGYTMQYNNPENSAYTTSRIELVRQHFVEMSAGLNISVNSSLPVVACPSSPKGDFSSVRYQELDRPASVS